MGVISQALSGLGALINKMYQFGDGNIVPMHVLSDLSGNAIDMSLPGEVVGNVAAGSAASGKPVRLGAVSTGGASTPGSTRTNGQVSDLYTDANGNLRVLVHAAVTGGFDATGNNQIVQFNGGDGVASTRGPLNVAPLDYNGVSWDRKVKPNAVSRLLSAAATTNATSVKGSAGNVFKVRGLNAAAAFKYLKLYNKASAPTVGSDVPVLTVALPASGPFDIDLGGSVGHYFSTGIAYAITGAAADNDTTALTAGDITCLNLTYA